MNIPQEIFSAINDQLGVKALFIADTGQSAYGTFGEHKPSYTVVGYDMKPDVYKFPRSSFMDTVKLEGYEFHIRVRFYSPEKFLRMAMNSTVGSFEIVSSPVQISVGNYGELLSKAVAHYFNPSLMWDSVTGTLIGMTNFKGEQPDITVSRAVHLLRLYMIRAMLEDGILPDSLRINEYMENRLDAPSYEKVSRVWEWAVVDSHFETNPSETKLCDELSFEKLRVANPVANVHRLQKNMPGFTDYANEILATFMEAM